LKLRFLICADPLEKLDTKFDLGVFVSEEILSREHEVFYCDLSQLNFSLSTTEFLSKLPAYKIHAADSSKAKSFWELGNKEEVNAESFHVILQRKDPPVDAIYKIICQKFSKLPKNILQVNNPQYTATLSEHQLPLQYKEFSADTYVCSSYSEFQNAFEQIENKRVVIKPEGDFAGNGIRFEVKALLNEAKLKEIWNSYLKKPVIIQPYLKEIQSIGDLRILCFNKKILGSLLRKPAPGQELANLHQGGSGHKGNPSPKQLLACQAVMDDLTPKGLYLLGLDFIGDHLTEVNITCPTLLKQIVNLDNPLARKTFIDECEGLVKSLS